MKFCDKFLNKHKNLELIFLPFAVLWLEVWLHIFDKTGLYYSVIFSSFAISLGCLLNLPLMLFKEKGKKLYLRIVSGLFCLIYAAEYITKEILQTYYPASILGTAAENKLYQFMGIIIQTVFFHILNLLILFLPFIASIILGKLLCKHKKKLRLLPIFISLFVIFHIAGLASLRLPWTGDLQPLQLYNMDINYNEQVEQLGLFTMLRLDIKHIFIPANYVESFKPIEPIEEKKPEIIETKPEEKVEVAEENLQEEIKEPEIDPIDRSPNALDIDFKTLSESTKNKNVKWLCDYFNSLTPTDKNEYTGMFKDYNVIFFTLEAFDSYAVSEKYTPNLYKLLNEGFVFNNYYTALHFTSTSNGECQNLLGLYPKNGKPITMVRTGQLKTNTYFTLAHQLSRQGYLCLGYHNNWDLYERSKSHPNAGYDWNFCSRGLAYEKSSSGDLKWPQRDSFMIEDSLDDYINSETPFHVYYLTVTSHTPYSWNWVASQYKEALADCTYSETTKAYIATLMEVDKAFGILLQKLEEAGKLDKTLIVASADHVPYTAIESIEEITGKDLGTSEAVRAINEQYLDLDVYRNGLIIWSSSMKEPIKVDKVCCQVDILPTLSNLLGLPYDSRLLSGSDILSTSEGMVVFSSRCWKTDKGLYNRFTQKFTPADGVEMSEEETQNYVESRKALAGYKLDCTDKIVENNFFEYLFPSK